MTSWHACKERREERAKRHFHIAGRTLQFVMFILVPALSLLGCVSCVRSCAQSAHAAEQSSVKSCETTVNCSESNEPIVTFSGFESLFEAYAIAYVGNRRGYDETAYQIVDSVMFWSRECGLNPFIVLRQIQKESDFRPNLTGAAGEHGLMQIMGFWWYIEDIWNGERLDPSRKYDIDENIKGGCLILKRHFYGSYPQALGQYNTGKPVVNGYAREVVAGAIAMKSDFVDLYYLPATSGKGE